MTALLDTSSLERLPDWLAGYLADVSDGTELQQVAVQLMTQEAPQLAKAALALGTAQVLMEIRADRDSVAAALLTGLPKIDEARVREKFGANITQLLAGLQRLRAMETWNATATTPSAQQLESLRKMLLAMAQDMRVVLIKLAEQVHLLRSLTPADDQTKRAAAEHTQNLFAPLANRLGVWQLKWELEDLAFRFLHPELYNTIARSLDERRVDRESYIALVLAQLREAMTAEGLRVEVQGRPKHIYSIYKKMREKDLQFDELNDVRAVRVLTRDVKDCYTALSVIHNLWQPVPGEFDDYIAHPKGNNYRSLHTAVVGPENKTLEVQIRTHDMHRESEFGIAAHWRYKEGGRIDRKYDEKIAWLRQVLDWGDELSLKQGGALFQDMVYVLTPQGQVIDLPDGATAVDFAYHVHTDLGHRCRGAKVNGAMVSLNYCLKSADRVEIVAAKQGGPSRDWLNANLGYLASHRALSKVRQWFHHQELGHAIATGRAALEKEMQRAGRTGIALEHIAHTLNYSSVSDMLAAIGHGELTSRQLQQAIVNDTATAGGAEQGSLTQTAKALSNASGVLVVGLNNIATLMAKCCKPVPPEAIVGFVTKKRGVMVHRADCSNVMGLEPDRAERLMPADWGRDLKGPYAVDIAIEAMDRNGLLRDISDAMTRERVNVTAANTLTKGAHATMFFTVEIPDLSKLQLLLQTIRTVPGVLVAGRRRS